MNLTDFVHKWHRSTLTERSASQQHFLDLCELIGHPKPASADPTGENFTFERGATKTSGGQGWADVWKRATFGWEYKGKHKDLEAAQRQLLQYAEALDNPPLLIVCDMTRLIIHTNFPHTPRQRHEIVFDEHALEELTQVKILNQLRDVFWHPERFEPGVTIEQITERAAAKLGSVAQTMGKRYPPTAVARFLDRIVFCLFAEDIDLLPARLFSRLLEQNRFDAARCSSLIGNLFAVMNGGGDFGEHSIRRFNGNLFNDELRFALTQLEVDAVREAGAMDWKNVDASIFGTLFERGLDPEKRSQLGAHYTRREDIETLIEPVVLQPLREQWESVRAQCEQSTAAQATNLVGDFLLRLSCVRVLDPSCGSGNFLYVTLQKMKHLEKAILQSAHDNHWGEWAPRISPEQLFGIELNAYAHDLAQTTVWIGYLQWMRDNGFALDGDPVLRKTDNFRRMDAILDVSEPDNPREAQWPATDYIVGNPPFLGGSKLWEELGRDYQQKLWRVYQNRVPGGADLCCYWFEKARGQIESGQAKRAGLLATQAIRGGANREVLKRIKDSGDIFFAISDQNWILNGANVHISMAAFDNGSQNEKTLDGNRVAAIHADLSSAADITQAKRLPENAGLCFIGTKKAGTFNLPEKAALQMLQLPNPHNKPNSDVLRPWLNGEAIVQRPAPQWIIDPGTSMTQAEFSLYENPYAHVETIVKPARDTNNEERARRLWWLHRRPAPEMREMVRGLSRIIATPRVSKYRIFAWSAPEVLPDDGVYIFARDDDYFFGILHSRIHAVWSLAQGTQLEDRPRYTPTTCFETFAFPTADEAQRAAIAEAARELNLLRENWLNPAAWTREETLQFPGSASGIWSRYVRDADSDGQGTVFYPRRVARDAVLAKNLIKRTLTNLYNERPAWLDNAHRALDAAVCAAYGWPVEIDDAEILARLLALNLERAGAK